MRLVEDVVERESGSLSRCRWLHGLDPGHWRHASDAAGAPTTVSLPLAPRPGCRWPHSSDPGQHGEARGTPEATGSFGFDHREARALGLLGVGLLGRARPCEPALPPWKDTGRIHEGYKGRIAPWKETGRTNCATCQSTKVR